MRKKTTKFIAILLSALLLQSVLWAPHPVYAQEEETPVETEEVQEATEEEEAEETEATEGEEAPAEEPAEAPEEETPDTAEEEEPVETEEIEEPAAGSIADVVSGELRTVSDDAIYQIEIGFEFDDGSFDVWASGTGFLITNRDIFTAQTLVDKSTTSNLYKRIAVERADAYRQVGVSLNNESEVEKGLRVIVTNTAGESFEVRNATTRNGMAIITMPEPVRTEVAVFQDTNRVNKEPGTLRVIKYDGNDRDKSDVQTTDVNIEDPVDGASNLSYRVSAEGITGQVLGAPVLDDAGLVNGVVSSTANPMTVIPNDSIETFLIANGVNYKTALSVENERIAEEEAKAQEEAAAAAEAIVDKSPLENKLREAQTMDLSPYTEESKEALYSAIEDGRGLLDATEVTNAQIALAVENLDTAIENLEELSFLQGLLQNTGLLIPTLLGILLLFAIVFMVLRLLRGRRRAARTPEPMEDESQGFSEELRRMEEEDLRALNAQRHARIQQEEDEAYYPGLVQKGSNEVYDEGLDVTNPTAPRNLRVPRNAHVEGVVYAEDGHTQDGGVSNLDAQRYGDHTEGDEGTTLLRENQRPVLVRVDNGQEIAIRDNFIIGKQRAKVDYCISGNPSVSRTHARIKQIEGHYYIEDLSSKNYTYVNGAQIAEYRPARLEEGARVRLSDVEFIYQVRSK